MDEQPFIMDIKLDGERLAIHIDNTLVSSTNTNTTTNTINNTGNSSSSYNNNSSSSGDNNDSSSKFASPVLMYTRRRNDYSEHYAPLGEIVRESVAVMTGADNLFFLCLFSCFVFYCSFHDDPGPILLLRVFVYSQRILCITCSHLI